ncbi:hypothetical protein IW261DRAFT_1425661 [Armillaria novae-zelandiae]|uniref:Uncharacterized protein n=1 Tax=Armillaria novae-zelandiae TaxID=153914 RepID=A0AA39NSJ3_9AGAR|nr:hypothetical protein IW261DRAFT_1425661 [Armillaria novae-zelandiae]
MPIKYYYIRAGLQAKDTFFGDIKRIYPRSSSLMDDFPAKILFEAERRYSKKLLHKNVNKMSVFSGWHSSLANPHYHYTLRAYNPAGWMAVTIEMEAANQGKVYTYYPQDWSRWMMHLRHVYYILKAQNIRKSPSSQDGKIVVLDMGRALLVNENVEFLDQVVTGMSSRKDKEQYDILSGIHHTLVYKTLYDDTTQMWSIRTVTAPYTCMTSRRFLLISERIVDLGNGYVINTYRARNTYRSHCEKYHKTLEALTLSLPRKDLICHPPNATIHPYVFKVPARTLLSVLPVMGRHDYACQYDYTAEQREYMSQQGILFERAVQDNHVLIFFVRLFEDWFDQWPITDDRSDAAVEQLKEISTLYIMGLKNQWVVHGLRPDGWTEEYVIDKLDYLEDMVVILWELRRVFVVELPDSTGN